MNYQRAIFVGVALVAVAPCARAVTMIYPVEAIDDLWQLPAEEFRGKYAGINISGLGPSDEGWYVRYKHENLTYLFGPVADREEARRKKWDMETVRDAAIRNRPTLASSQVDFVKFSYSGVYGKGGGDSPYDGSASARISKDGKSGPDGDLDGDGIPNAKDDDMDGDGIVNGQDGDADGDGIPNGTDDYSFGSDPGPDGNGKGGIAKDGSGDGSGEGDGSGKGGKGGKAGAGQGDGDKLAGSEGGDGDGDGAGGQKGGKSGSAGGSEGGGTGQQGQKGRQVASNQRGGQSGSQGGQSGSQSGQQGGSQGGGASGGGASGGQPGGGGGPPSGGGGGGGGNPLQMVVGLLRMILGI